VNFKHKSKRALSFLGMSGALLFGHSSFALSEHEETSACDQYTESGFDSTCTKSGCYTVHNGQKLSLGWTFTDPKTGQYCDLKWEQYRINNETNQAFLNREMSWRQSNLNLSLCLETQVSCSWSDMEQKRGIYWSAVENSNQTFWTEPYVEVRKPVILSRMSAANTPTVPQPNVPPPKWRPLIFCKYGARCFF